MLALLHLDLQINTAAEVSLSCHAGCEPEREDHSGDDLNSIGRRAADIVHTTRRRSDLPELNLGLRACQGAAPPAECSACLSAPQPDGSTCYLLLSLHDRCRMHLTLPCFPAGKTSNNTIELCRQALEVRPWPHLDLSTQA